MPCSGTRFYPRSGAQPAPIVMIFGEQGLIELEYIGSNSLKDTLYGEITDFPYPFHRIRVLYVDNRDAVFLLKDGEFILGTSG